MEMEVLWPLTRVLYVATPTARYNKVEWYPLHVRFNHHLSLEYRILSKHISLIIMFILHYI
jgi:hypothetical protein